MTVEHLVGKSQGGYLKQIRIAVAVRFPELSANEHEDFSKRLDTLNTVTACSFCNATTSRDINNKSMSELLNEAEGSIADIEVYISNHLQLILERKRKDVQWKISSVKEAFEKEFLAKIC